MIGPEFSATEVGGQLLDAVVAKTKNYSETNEAMGTTCLYLNPKVCYRLRDRGLLAKPTHGDIIRSDVVLSP